MKLFAPALADPCRSIGGGMDFVAFATFGL